MRGIGTKLILVFAVFSFSSNSFADGMKSPMIEPNCTNWKTISLNKNNWEVAYDGYGEVTFDKGLKLMPKSAFEKDKTHAALVLTKEMISAKKFAIRINYANEKQLRSPAANPWEVFWLFFNYKKGEKDDKNTNYFIFKPNGTELGTASGQVEQSFLSSDETAKAKLGENYELKLFRINDSIQAYINGKSVMNYLDKENKLINQDGQIGLYTEDALVKIKKVEVCSHFSESF